MRSDGRAVGWQGTWILDAIIMGRDLSLALAISAGALSEIVDWFDVWIDLDFYRMGKPLPESIYMKQSATRMGLNLPRGPDPRSYNPGLAMTAVAGRSILGLEM